MSPPETHASRNRARGPLLLAVLVTTTVSASCGGPVGEPLEITVPSGAGFVSVLDTLVARELVGWGTGFRLMARIRGDDREIRAGRYSIRKGEPWSEILETLTTGRVETEGVTIPEGFTLDNMAPRLATITGVAEEEVAAALKSEEMYERFDVPGPTLEGFLFPDTYRFAQGVSLETAVDAMVARYGAYWTADRRARLDSIGMSELELVTLASIIQAEARRTEEMTRISSVYHNRLDIGYLLQADPTVLYALGGHRERLLFAAMDSVADHPYNTYTQAGLPPGPIGAPGALALDAALRPDSTDLLYFVARPNGEHIFTRSLAEHNRAVARARRERDSGSTSGSDQRSPDGAP